MPAVALASSTGRGPLRKWDAAGGPIGLYLSNVSKLSDVELRDVHPVTARQVTKVLKKKRADELPESAGAAHRSAGHGLLLTGLVLALFGFALVTTDAPQQVVGWAFGGAGLLVLLAAGAALSWAWWLEAGGKVLDVVGDSDNDQPPDSNTTEDHTTDNNTTQDQNTDTNNTEDQITKDQTTEDQTTEDQTTEDQTTEDNPPDNNTTVDQTTDTDTTADQTTDTATTAEHHRAATNT